MTQLMENPEIAALHEDAVAAHRATLTRLMADPDYVALRKQLKSVPKISPPAEIALLELIGEDVPA